MEYNYVDFMLNTNYDNALASRVIILI